jgi:hypothetical protein
MSEELTEIHAYADGELSAEEAERVKRRIETDPQAAAEYEAVRHAKFTLSQKCLPMKNDDAWQSCRARLDAIDKTRSTESFVTRYAWALSALFLFALVGAGVFNRSAGRDTVSTAQVAGLFSRFTPVAEDTRSNAQLLVEDKVGPVPVDCRKLTVQDVLYGQVDNRDAALVQFVDAEGPGSLLVIENARGIEGMRDSNVAEYRIGTINGTNSIAWSEDRFVMAVMADRKYDELKLLANHIRNSP